jgi:hypothetical protein
MHIGLAPVTDGGDQPFFALAAFGDKRSAFWKNQSNQ